ncbi:S-layer homology domain-containing protein [Paenibacillus taihuensis]|uniref:S-layer homology domain-containing protein n=1 Tax=Paenibacillus taihuensis TaxID=1156355 RepID=UPI000E27AD1D|nr:S-layer homology domain-containing protein [Paenibacillus taihuensis]
MNRRFNKTIAVWLTALIVFSSALPVFASAAYASEPSQPETAGTFADSPQPGQIRIYAGADAGNSDTQGNRMVGSIVKERYLNQNFGSEAKIASQGDGVESFARYGWHKKVTKRVANGDAYFSYRIPIDPSTPAPLYVSMETIGETKLTAEGTTLLNTGNSGLGVQTPWEFTLDDPALWADGYVELKFEDADPSDGEGVNLFWLELGRSSAWRDRIKHIVWDTSAIVWQAGYYEGTASEFKGSANSLQLTSATTDVTTASSTGKLTFNWNQPAPAAGKKYYLLAGLIGGAGSHTFDMGSDGSVETTREASKERITDWDVTSYIKDGANSVQIQAAPGASYDFVSLVEVTDGSTSDNALKVVFKGNEMARNWTRLVNNTMFFHMDMMTEKSTGFIDSSLPNGIFPLLYWVADSAPAMLEMARWGYTDEAKQASLFRSAGNHYSGDNGAAGLVFATIAYLIKGDNYTGDYADKAWPIMKDGLDYYVEQIGNNPYHLIKGTGLETTNKGYGIYNNSIAYFVLLAGAEAAGKMGYTSEQASWLAAADSLADGIDNNLIAHDDISWLGHTIKKDTWRYSLNGEASDGSDAPWINAGWFGVGGQEELYYGYKAPADTRNHAVEDWREVTNNTLNYHSENFWEDWKLYGHNRGFGTDYGVLSERGGWPLLSMLMGDRMEMAKKNLQHIIWNSTDLNFANDNEGVQETSPWLLVREVNKSDHGIAEPNEIGNGGSNEDMNLVEYIVTLKNVRIMAGLDDSLEGTDNLAIVPRLPSSWDGVDVNGWSAHYRTDGGDIAQTKISYDYDIKPERAKLEISAEQAISGAKFRFGPFAKDAVIDAVIEDGTELNASRYEEQISGDSKWVWVEGDVGTASSVYEVQADLPHLSFSSDSQAADWSGWSSQAADSWTVDTEQGVLQGQSEDGDSFLNANVQQDLIYSSDVLLAQSSAAGLTFRTDETGTQGYDFVLDAAAGTEGELRLADRNGTVLYEQPMHVNVNRTYTLKVVASGPILMGYLDGTKVFHIIDSTYASGHAGLYVRGSAAFDNALALDSAASVSIPALESVSISSYKTNTLLMTQEKEIPVIATFDNGETLDVTHVPALRQYVISDPEVLEDTGSALKAGKVGSADVYAVVTINGVTKQSNTLHLNVEELSHAEIYFKNDATSLTLLVGQIAQVWPWAKLQDDKWWFLGYMPASMNIEYFSSDPSVASVTYDPADSDPENRSVLHALSAGTATITMAVTVNGITVVSPNSVSVTVIDPSQFTGFSDSFDDGNMDGWAQNGPGVWSVVDGKAQVNNLQPTGWDSWNIVDAQGGDFVYSGDVTFVSGSAAGLSFRTNETGTVGYDLILDKYDGVKLAGRPYRAFKTASASFADNQTYHVKVVAKGANIKVYLDGVLKLDYNETDYGYTFGQFGLFSFQSTVLFDNLLAETSFKLDQVTATLDSATLLRGGRTNVQLTGKLNTEEAADLSEAQIVYASSDEAVATVDQNGHITAVGAGSASISADVTLHGTTVHSNAAILYVSEDMERPILKQTVLTLASDQLNIGAEMQAVVSGTMTDDTAADLASADIVYASSNPSIAAVSAGGTVTAEGFGTAVITASVTLDGVTQLSNAANVTVAGTETFTEDFEDGDTTGWSPNGGMWSNAGDRMKVQYDTPNSWFDAWNIFNKKGQDFSYSADVKLISGNSAGISFRTNGSGSQGYDVIFSIFDGLKLAKRPYAVLASYTGFTKQTDRTYHIQVVAKGANMKVYLDDALAIDYTDNTYASGQFGLFAFQGTAEYDNLQVQPWDTELPVWVNGTLSASDVTSAGMKLQWSGAADENGLSQYRIYQNGAVIATVPASVTDYELAGLTANTAYDFKVEAKDEAGNWSTNGPTAHALTLQQQNEDLAAPAWEDGAALTASAVTQTSVQLQWSEAADDTGVEAYRVYRDGRLLSTVAGDTRQYPVTGLSAGSTYSFKVEAGDAAGNWSENSLILTVQTASAPVLPPVTASAKPLPDNLTAISEEQWHSSQAGKVTISLPAGKDGLLLPGDTLAKLGKGDLIVQGTAGTATIHASALAAAESLLQAVGQGAELVISIRTLPAEQGAALTNAAGVPGLQLRLVGSVTSVAFSAVDKDGKIIELAGSGDIPGQLTLHYDPKQVDDRLLGAYRYDEAAKSWVFIPGAIDRNRHQANWAGSALVHVALLQYDKTYEDVAAAHWGNAALKVMTAQHLVTGTSSTAFTPEAKTTRAEFAAMLSRLLDLHAEHEAAFTDVASDSWYADSVAAASEAGIITGFGNGSFDPDAPITREQIAVMLIRAFHYKMRASAADGQPSGSPISFKDAANMSDWAADAVAQAAALGLMNGQSGGMFAPKSDALRIETVQSIYNLYSLFNEATN